MGHARGRLGAELLESLESDGFRFPVSGFRKSEVGSRLSMPRRFSTGLGAGLAREAAGGASRADAAVWCRAIPSARDAPPAKTPALRSAAARTFPLHLAHSPHRAARFVAGAAQLLVFLELGFGQDRRLVEMRGQVKRPQMSAKFGDLHQQ